MIDYTDESTYEEREQLDSEISGAKEACEHLLQSFRDTDLQVNTLENESKALEEAVSDRVGHLRDRLSALREVVNHQAQAVVSLSDDLSQRADAAAKAYVAGASDMQGKLDLLRQHIELSGKAAKQRAQAVIDKAVANTTALDDQLARVKAALDHCMQVTDTELRSHTTHLGHTTQECASHLEDAVRQSLRGVVTDGLQSHRQTGREILSRKKAALDDLATQLRTALGQISTGFDTSQLTQLASLGNSLQQTESAVTAAMSSLTGVISDFSSSATQVCDALETTQSGLRLVVGSLERTQRVLEAIETL